MKAEIDHLQKILTAGVVIAIGLIVLKYIPMAIWGPSILFDASGHLSGAIFVLYVLWFFVDQNKRWRLPFIIFAAFVLVVISLQRIVANAHNDVGLLLGLLVGLSAIGVAEWKTIRKRLDF
ncbi:MAG: phosphatase PAP2 family protein [Candidatus Kerfeldbacteria bacterium]|nr:phosphatase PAP2 family protein [Candidatus Kerfeldbacteria bacterium]